MLAQGQSSSAKRGGLAAVSSGLIFLKKINKRKTSKSLLFHAAVTLGHCRASSQLGVLLHRARVIPPSLRAERFPCQIETGFHHSPPPSPLTPSSGFFKFSLLLDRCPARRVLSLWFTPSFSDFVSRQEPLKCQNVLLWLSLENVLTFFRAAFHFN